MKKKVGLFIGRFQPIHTGHISAVQQMLDFGLKKIVIGLGSSSGNIDAANPFSNEERMFLISKSLHHHFPDLCFEMLLIPDFPTDSAWVEYIINTINPEYIFSGNPWTKECFVNTSVKIVDVNFEKSISATQIRQAWRRGKLYETKVYLDDHVYDFLVERRTRIQIGVNTM